MKRATLTALVGLILAGGLPAQKGYEWDQPDGLGVRSAGPDFEHRLAYIAWLCVLEGPWLLVLAVVLRPRTVWSHLRRNWWRGAVFSVLSSGGVVPRGILRSSNASATVDPDEHSRHKACEMNRLQIGVA